MASLIEDLTETLLEELDCYKELLKISTKKTDVIINGDVPSLQKLTNEEQTLAGRVFRLDKKREELINDIGIVINKKPEELTLLNLIDMLDSQLKEKEKLYKINEELRSNLSQLKEKNEQNKVLIQQSLDFIDFTVNAIRSSRNVPETAGYENKGTSSQANNHTSMFDAKQ
ncbi:MAG: flagellar protein FlgN [Eubacteriales bacterium]